MAFPSNPVNGQQANVNGITYTYSTALTSWNVSTSVSNSFVSLSASGNVNSGNVISAGIVSATGNITGSYIIGNGSQLTGLPASYGNANVVANLAALGSNPISTTGNITGGYILGNGSQLSGISVSTSKIFNGTSEANIGASGGNANITIGGTANVAVFATSGQYVTGIISATGNITGGNLSGTSIAGTLTTAAQTNITSVGTLTSLSVTGNITGGNLTTAGTMTAATVTETSSVALKENFRLIEDPLEKVLQLLGQIYDRKDGSSRDEAGLVAEDVYKIIPNLVKTDANGNPESVFYSRLSVYLLEALKVLHDEVKQLKAGK